MKYQELYTYFKKQHYVTLEQIRVREPDFLRTNLVARTKKWLLRKVANGVYVFADELIDESVLGTLAGIVYQPSYVSMESALRHYDLIPEGVYTQTSLTTRKTTSFSSEIGTFKYQTCSPKLFRWYTLLKNTRWTLYRMAEPEKALLDFLYLKPHFWTTVAHPFEELRIEPRQAKEILDLQKLRSYADVYPQRIRTLAADFITYVQEND